MEQGKQYYAFISYKSEDVEWAIWLQHELEHYHLPASFNGRTDIRQELRPVFRDIDELSAGNLPEQIRQALKNSQNLIVVCSPQAAASPWVNQELETFISLGRTDRIFPFIVEGNSPKEFFPPALLTLPKNEERLGGDASKQGRDIAFVKIVAGMLGIGFDSLWNRYEKEKAEEERKQREQRDHILQMQSRIVAEKAEKLIEEGDSYLARLLALKVLPKDINNPDRPYTPEADSILRRSYTCTCSTYSSNKAISFAKFSPNGKYLIASLLESAYIIWDVSDGRCVNRNNKQIFATHVAYSKDSKRIVTSEISSGIICIWDSKTNRLLQGINTGEECVRIAEFYNDDKELIIVTDYGAARIWSIKEKKFKAEFGHSRCVPHDSDICPNKGLYCYHDTNGRVVVKHLLGSIVFETKDNYRFIGHIAISEDGELLGYVTEKDLFIWNIQKNQLIIKTRSITTPVVSIKFNTKHKIIAVAYYNEEKRGIDLYDINKWRHISHIGENVDYDTIMEFSKENNAILICNPNSYHVRIYNYLWGNNTKCLKGHRAGIVSVGFNRLKQLMATADEEGNVFIWDLAKNKRLSSFNTHIRNIFHLIISQDDTHVVIISGTDIGTDGGYILRQKEMDNDIGWIVSIWDYCGNLINIIDAYEPQPSCASFVKNGKCICLGARGRIQMWKNLKNNYVKKWEIDNVEDEIFEIEERNNIISVLHSKSRILLCDFETGKRILEIKVELEEDDYINCLSLSSNNHYLAYGTSEGNVSIWDIKKLTAIVSWKSSLYRIESICFDYSETKVFTLSIEALQVWDVETGKFIQTLDSNMNACNCNQSILYIGERELLVKNGVTIYSFRNLGYLIDLAQEQFINRELTAEERRDYYLD